MCPFLQQICHDTPCCAQEVEGSCCNFVKKYQGRKEAKTTKRTANSSYLRFYQGCSLTKCPQEGSAPASLDFTAAAALEKTAWEPSSVSPSGRFLNVSRQSHGCWMSYASKYLDSAFLLQRGPEEAHKNLQNTHKKICENRQHRIHIRIDNI